MTPEQLLQPRRKVMADYPKSIYDVGTIINAGGQSEDLLYCDWDGPRCRDYPHLFKKIQWWEDRKPEDMPQFVKGLKKVKKVVAIEDHGGEYLSILVEGETIWGTIWMYEPATEAEYITYKNSKQ